MNGSERELGRLVGAVEALSDRVDRIDVKLEKHIEDENKQLHKIEQQLSLSRFLWLTTKAVVLTIVFVFAFKFGDITNLWKALK